MAEGKNIDLKLNIITALTGMSAFNQLSHAMGGIAKQAGLANLTLGKMAAGAAGLVLAFKGIESVGEFMKGAKEEAMAAQKANEKLGIALSRNPKLAKMGAEVIKGQQEELIKLAENMEKTGVESSIALRGGFAGLAAAGFGPATIAKVSKGFEGLVVATKGIGASKEDVAEVAQSIKTVIKLGRVPREFAAKAGITKADLQEFKKANSERARALWIQKIMERQEWRVGAAMKTTDGILWRSQQSWKRLQETAGKPFVDTQVAFAEALGNIGDALLPLTQRIADGLTPALKGLAGWLKGLAPGIQKFGQDLADIWDYAASAAGGAVGTIKQVWGGLSSWFGSTVIKPLGNLFAPVFDPLVKAANDIWPKISGPLHNVMVEVSKIFEHKQFLNPATGNYEALTREKPDLSAIKENMDAIGKVFTEYDWGPVIATVGQGALTVGQNIGKSIVAGIGDLGNWISQKFQSIPWGDIGANIVNYISNIPWGDVAAAVGEGLGNAFKMGVGATHFALDAVGSAITNGLMSLPWLTILDQGMTNFFEGAGDVAIRFAEGVVKGITGYNFSEIGTVLSNAFKNAWNSIAAEVSTWPGKIMAMLSNLVVNVAANLMGPQGTNIATATQQATAANKGAPSPQAGSLTGRQFGGLVSRPSLVHMAEKGIPEMVIPMQGGSRSRGLLASTATALGMGAAFGAGGGAGGVNLSMSVPITVNGVPSGQEGAIGREVERALQDPINTLLAQLRKAKDEEKRLAYV